MLRAIHPPELRQQLALLHGPVGFVPTMGALHAGHRALLARARRECAVVVASIFVNPTQFGPHEDLERYPRPLEADLAACAAEGVDLVYTPTLEDVYPPGFATRVRVEGPLSAGLCGAWRPGHFEGVATVVARLFGQVRPDRAYFGQKDFQQLAVVTRMVEDLQLPLTVVPCPTVREPDGLALSSRNRYLSDTERATALELHRTLTDLQRAWQAGMPSLGTALERERERLKRLELTLQYLEVVQAATLQPADAWGPDQVALVAAVVGATRLIDNVRLSADGPEERP